MRPGFATPSVRRLKGLSAYGQPFVRLLFILCIYYMTTNAYYGLSSFGQYCECASAYTASWLQ